MIDPDSTTWPLVLKAAKDSLDFDAATAADDDQSGIKAQKIW